MKRIALCPLAIAMTMASLAPAAGAQSFPPDSEWNPLFCGDEVMTDPFQDETQAIGERDIVGQTDAAAGYWAADDEFLYLRVRVEQTPLQDPDLRPFAWGMAIDVDLDLTTYEVLALVDGIDGQVRLYQNTITTVANSPDDPADDPAVATYDVATHTDITVAPGTAFGDDDDWFLSFAIPWDDLVPLGVTPATPMRVWAASSSTANSLDGDLACHDGQSGDPTLDGTASGDTIADPDGDADGDGVSNGDEVEAGTDPNDPDDFPTGPGPDPTPTGDLRLEGGGGCAIASPGDHPASSPWLWAALATVLSASIAKRRRRSSRWG